MWGGMKSTAEQRATESNQRHLYFGGRQLGTLCLDSQLCAKWILDSGEGAQVLWSTLDCGKFK